MHIVHIASELAPIAKVGGLADVVLGLSRELSAQGHQVEVILPKFDCLIQRDIEHLEVYLDLKTTYGGQKHIVKVWTGTVQGVRVYFIDSFAPKSFFNHGRIYGATEDIDRYCYFSRAALEFLDQSGRRPTIIHTHDWPTGAVAPLLREQFAHTALATSKVIFTIHNVEYQGQCSPSNIDLIGLNGVELLHSGKLSDNVRPDLINLMKGAIVYSDFFTTVSPTYAQEVLTPREGRHLEGTIAQFQHKFAGVLNGIDYDYWNPTTDPMLIEHFSLRDLSHNNWDGKDRAKKALQERLNLAQENRPIISCIARLIPQKGIHLLEHAMTRTQQQGGQFVLLGTSPMVDIQAFFEHIKAQNRGNHQLHLVLRTSEELAHQIFAGSDMLLIPSVFEPCGLTQMIGMRYGTVPIVRRTGGLADTVFDVETSGVTETEANGFTFDDADPSGINWGIDRAIAWWRDTPERWRQLVLRGMKQDFSWKQATQRYLEIYTQISADS